MWFFTVIVAIWFIITIIFCLSIYKEFKKSKENKMSIRESMNLINLPVVTFENGNKKFNFIIDTGANDSIINAKCEDILVTPHNVKNKVQGIMGSDKECHTVLIEFKYNDTIFETMFNVVDDVNDLFNEIKKESGVTVHGILGNNFLDKYNYVIDYKDYIIYRKK